MSRFLKNISRWFGYSRRERRASLILLFIVFIVVVSRFILPSGKSSLKIIPTVSLQKDPPVKKERERDKETTVIFEFDPNSASEGELARLGMNEQQSRTLIKYREKGGRFMKAGDLGKIYGMDSILAAKLLPYIKIAEQPAVFQKARIPDTIRKHFRSREALPKTDLNRCDSAELEKLPWIGPVLSARIIKYRVILGGFYSVEQLQEVYGISDSIFNFVSGRVKVDSNDIKPIEINKVAYNELMRHPYLERYDVQSIIKFRSISGKIESISQLVENRILTPQKASRVKPYFRF